MRASVMRYVNFSSKDVVLSSSDGQSVTLPRTENTGIYIGKDNLDKDSERYYIKGIKGTKSNFSIPSTLFPGDILENIPDRYSGRVLVICNTILAYIVTLDSADASQYFPIKIDYSGKIEVLSDPFKNVR
jgi:hypothetical protein